MCCCWHPLSRSLEPGLYLRFYCWYLLSSLFGQASLVAMLLLESAELECMRPAALSHVRPSVLVCCLRELPSRDLCRRLLNVPAT